MAIAVDASTPVRFAGTGSSITSASFTAPTDALLVLCGNADGSVDDPETVSDTGSLTWTQRVARKWAESTSGGYSAIWTARTTSSTSRTVTMNLDRSGNQKSAKLYVLTGVDVDGTPVDTVTANNEGFESNNSFNTTSVTPGATGLLVAADTDWNANGTFQSSSNLTQDTAHYAGAISVCSGYRTCTSGVGVSGNFDAAGGAGAAAHHKWCQIVVREPAAATKARTPRRRPYRFITRRAS